MKKLFLGLFLMLAPIPQVYAQDEAPACVSVQVLKDHADPGVVVEVLSKEDQAKIEEAFGTPPMEHDALGIIHNQNGAGQIFVLKDGCSIAHSQVMPYALLARALGRDDGSSND
jgi:hypothetical protein